MRFAPGTRVGPYEVLSLLGTGGMAEVYRARDPRLGRDVALKVLSEALGTDAELLARLEREAKLGGSLSHPNVVVVHDVGLHEGFPYFVTELLDGETLRQRLVRGPVPLSTALEWSVQLASGLAAAHERGVIHRDLKPENVFVTRDGRLKLLDFGIARLSAATPNTVTPRDGLNEPTAPSSGDGTRTGMVLGTPAYMAPEQVRGERVDMRSDLFSLGAVLYELFSGKRAFLAGTAIESGYAILHNEPEPLSADIPVAVAETVRRCLQKDPAQRFQSARDLAFHLETLRSPTGSTVPLPKSTRRWRLPVVTLVAGALVAGMAVLALLTRLPLLAGPAPAPSIQPLTARPGSALNGRFGPDGRTVYFTAIWEDDRPRVYSLSIGKFGGDSDYSPLPIDVPADVQSVSSTGELAVLVNPVWTGTAGGTGTLARVPGVGGSPREIVESVGYAAWAPDGAGIAIVREADGYQLEYPIGHVLYRSKYVPSGPAVSRSGALAIFESASVGSGKVIVFEPDGTKRVVLENWFVNGLRWSPDEENLWFAGSPVGGYDEEGLWVLTPGHEPQPMFRGLGNLVLEDLGRNRRVLVRSYQYHLDVALAKTTGAAVKEHLGYFAGPTLGAVSADGKSVLLSEWSGGFTGAEWVYLRRADASAPVRLGPGHGYALSADGKWALVRDANQTRLWLLPTAAGTARNVDLPELAIRSARFVGGASKALVVAVKKDEVRGFLVDLETGSSRPVTPSLTCCSIAVSPDSQLVAALPADGPVSAYSLQSDTAPKAFPELGRNHRIVDWCARGLIVISDEDQAKSSVRLRAFDPGTRVLRDFSTLAPRAGAGTTRVFRVGVSADGDTVGYSYGHYTSSLYLLDFGGRRP